MTHFKMRKIPTIILFLSSLYFSPAIATQSPPAIPDHLLANERNSISVFQRTAPLVVFVNNITRYRRDFFSFDATEVQQGAGSGFIWDDQGHIITNYHVIKGAYKATVTLKNGETLETSLVGFEERKDIAVLKVDPKDLPQPGMKSKIADSSKLLVGQKTIAIGNPFGLDHSMSTGIVSALGRSFPSPSGVTIRDMIQTDAAINPGNSGGPLLDSSGQLIGMNTAIYSASGSSAGIGFAVPSNTIKRIVSQIIQFGRVINVGIGFAPLPDHYQQYLGYDGVMVGKITKKDSRRTGLKGITRSRNRVEPGDIIVGINDTEIKNYDDLYNALEKKKVGEEISIKFLRKGKQKERKIKLIQLK